MIAIIISLLIQLGYIQSEAHWNQLSTQEQETLTEIVIDDVTNS